VVWLEAAALIGGSSAMAMAVFGACLAAGFGCAGSRWHGAVVVLACAAAVAVSCGWRNAALEASPLRPLATHRAVITAEAVVAAEPHHFQRFGSKSTLVRLDVVRASTASGSVSGHAPVLAVIRGTGDDLTMGRRLAVAGRLRPARQPDVVAALDVVRRSSRADGAWWWLAAERVRAGVRHAVSGAPPDGRALVPALVDGEDTAISERVQEEFRRAGLTHLLAVSGTNLTIVLVLVLGIARAVGVGRLAQLLVGAGAIVGFVLVARPDPSVLRAAAMGSIGLVAAVVGGRGGVRLLASAILALLFLDPWLARAPGFLLSACATAGIVLGARPLAARFSRWMPPWCALTLTVPLAAQVACLPALAVLSGQISVVGVAANLLVAPLVAPTTVLGLAGGLLDLGSTDAGRLVGIVAAGFASLIVDIAHLTAGFAGAAVPWHAPWWMLVVGFPALLIGIWRMADKPAVVCGVAIGLTIAVARPPQPGWPPSGWVAVACDVGQGDATVIRAGEGSAILVDAGPEPLSVDGCLRRLRVTALPLAVITHAHADHLAGWSGAVRGRKIGLVLHGPSGGPGEPTAAGDQFRVGPIGLEVVWPPADLGAPAATDGTAMNNSSVVLRASAHGARILLAGDVETEAQEAMLAAGAPLAADVLKFPHHGSGRQSEPFLEAVSARVATISVGADNDYGHPAALALEMLRRVSSDWRRTDVDGDIAVVVRDGRLLVVTRH
jgi:competence protein ComEC